MSSFRRTLRTTAAAVGIAALGTGLAGTAFAAPEVPAIPGIDGLGSMPDLATLVQAPDVASDVPSAFNFEPPHLNPVAPTSAQTGMLKDFGNVGSPAADPSSSTRPSDVGALAAMDTARTMDAPAPGASDSTTEADSAG